MKLRTLLLASAAALMTAGGAASAASIPGAISVGDNNDGVNPVYGVNSQSGLFGANWYLVGGPADITVEYLGAEAGWLNEFDFGNDGVDFTTPGIDTWTPAVGSTTYNSVASGLLSFSFITDAGSVFNGANPDNSNTATVNFFSYLHAGAQTLDLWLDDTGGGNDDNHDDMLIRLSIASGNFAQVPLPAAGWMLLAGLGGIGVAARRKKKA